MNSSSLGHRSSLTVPTPVALTLLATGTVLVPVVNATFPTLAVLVCGALALAGLTAVLAVRKQVCVITFDTVFPTRGRQPSKASWTMPRRAMI